MSHDNYYWGGRGNCPKCGRWVGQITGTINYALGELVKVTGVCKHHGEVDLSEQAWDYDDFDHGEDE